MEQPFLIFMYFLIIAGYIASIVMAYNDIDEFQHDASGSDSKSLTTSTAIAFFLTAFTGPFILFSAFNAYLTYRNKTILSGNNTDSSIFLTCNLVLLFFSIPIFLISLAILLLANQSLSLGLVLLFTSLVSIIFTWSLVFKQNNRNKIKVTLPKKSTK